MTKIRAFLFSIIFIIGSVSVIATRYNQGVNAVTGGSANHPIKVKFPELDHHPADSMSKEILDYKLFCDFVPGCDRIFDYGLKELFQTVGYYLFDGVRASGGYYLEENKEVNWVMTSATPQRRYHFWLTILCHVMLQIAYLSPILFFTFKYFESTIVGALFLSGSLASMCGWMLFHSYHGTQYIVPFDFISTGFYFLCFLIADKKKISWGEYILSFIYGQLGYMYLGLLACGSLIGRFASTGLRRNLSLIVKIVLKSAALSVSMYAAVLYIIYRINGFVMIGYTKYPKSPNDPIPARTWFDDYASYNTVEYVFFNMLRISWRGIAFGSILGIACFICEILGIKTLRIEDKRRFYFIAAGGFAAYSVVFYGGWYSVNYFGELGRQLLPLIVMSVLAALLLTFEGLGFARQFYLNRRTAEAAR